jgi:hypothetical protein
LINGSEESSLREKIPDPAYYRHFIGVAKRLAPDGNDVNLVGFATARGGVKFTTPRNAIRLSIEAQVDEGSQGERKTITGTLLLADAAMRSSRQTIGIRDAEGRKHSIIVPEGVLDDIVKPLWNETVTIEIFADRDQNYFIDIMEVTTS